MTWTVPRPELGAEKPLGSSVTNAFLDSGRFSTQLKLLFGPDRESSTRLQPVLRKCGVDVTLLGGYIWYDLFNVGYMQWR